MRSKGRVAVVDAYVFPTGIFDVGQREPATGAARQWFRLAARHPRATMSMPSAVIDRMWLMFTRHEGDYAEFCKASIGRAFPYSSQTGSLATTYRLAREDEPGGLPLLFRIDRELGVEGGRHYIEDCGGRGQCYPVPGATCLTHLTGPGRETKRGWTKRSDLSPGPICGFGGGDVGG